MPRASLRSVLLIRAFNAALMCRVSTQITSALNSHCNSGPASNPMRLKCQAGFFNTASNAAGSLATFISRTILPVSSTIQTGLLDRNVQSSKMLHAALLLLMLEARSHGDDLVSPSA